MSQVPTRKGVRCPQNGFLFPTVDGSEIPSPTTWDFLKTLANNGINYQPQLVIAGFLKHQLYHWLVPVSNYRPSMHGIFTYIFVIRFNQMKVNSVVSYQIQLWFFSTFPVSKGPAPSSLVGFFTTLRKTLLLEFTKRTLLLVPSNLELDMGRDETWLLSTNKHGNMKHSEGGGLPKCQRGQTDKGSRKMGWNK